MSQRYRVIPKPSCPPQFFGKDPRPTQIRFLKGRGLKSLNFATSNTSNALPANKSWKILVDYFQKSLEGSCSGINGIRDVIDFLGVYCSPVLLMIGIEIQAPTLESDWNPGPP